MPALAHPSYLLAAGAASLVVVVLHLLAWRRPTPVSFPTARFIPPSAVRAVSRAIRPTDVVLMCVRVAALLLAGVALARPVVAPVRRGTARVMVVDVSRRVADVAAAIDSARAHATGADEVVWVRVDSSAVVVPDSLRAERSQTRGELAAGLVAAIREAQRVSRTREHVEIVVVSPFASESWSAAMPAIRSQWSGTIAAVRLPMRGDDMRERVAGADGAAASAALPPVEDPVGAAFALARDSATPPIRVTRDALTAGDSAWARGGDVLVWWPRSSQAADRKDAPSVAILGDGTQSVAGHLGPLDGIPLPGPAILRWSDGTVAATEQPLGAGCLRTIAVDLPSSGDEVLRPGFTRLVRSLATPCGGGVQMAIADSVISRWVEGSVSAGTRRDSSRASSTTSAGPSVSLRPDQDASSSPALSRALLAGVALLLLLEWWIRRARNVRLAAASSDAPSRREAA